MNEAIILEARFYLNTVFYGILIVASYDILRLLRRIISHSFFWLSLEDFVFWTVSAYLVFRMFYRFHEGVLRGPAFAALFCGMIIWHYAVSNPMMRFLTNRAILPVKRRVRRMKQGLKNWGSRCKMAVTKKKKRRTKRECKKDA